MSGKFYEWNGSTLVLDPGVFAWDLPRRGADWQVGYFPRDGMGSERTLVSDIEKAGKPFFQASEQAAREGSGLVGGIKRYFQLSGMGAEPTVTSELEEAGEHLIEAGAAAVRAGEGVVLDVEPVITKAPDRFVDYAMQHPWMTLFFGASLGVFLTMYVQKRRRISANPSSEFGELMEHMDEAIEHRDGVAMKRISWLLLTNYGLSRMEIFNVFRKAHPGLTMAEFDNLIDNTKEL